MKKRRIRVIKKLAIVVMLWVTVGLMIGLKRNETTIVSAFDEVHLENVNATLSAYGYVTDSHLTENAKKTFLRNIAENIGIFNGNTTTKTRGDVTVSEYLMDGKNAKTSIKLITKEEKENDNIIDCKQYIAINIDFYSNIDEAMKYKKIINDMLRDRGIASSCTVNLKGSCNGNLDVAMRNLITDNLLTQMKAKIVAENRTETMYTVYAYSNKIDECVEIGGKKINLNICVYYDEECDKTFYYVATPLNNEDF